MRLAALLCLVLSSLANAAQRLIDMDRIDASGNTHPIGTLAVSATPYGVLFEPDLGGLRPGLHGFHIHENADCGPAVQDGPAVAGLAAGGHWDPGRTGRHEGPYGDGHLGDLPALYVNEQGRATLPLLAPRIAPSDLEGHALIIHEGADNYSDVPEKLGGGGARVACGVVRAQASPLDRRLDR